METKKTIKRKSRKRYITIPNENNYLFSEGTKVMLNLKNIKSHPDYNKYSFMYRYFVENNSKKIFTVEYEKGKSPNLVTLKEDITNPKWLFFVGDLSQVVYIENIVKELNELSQQQEKQVKQKSEETQGKKYEKKEEQEILND